MRAKQGGGTCKIKQDLLRIGQEFFFPGEKSVEGQLSGFELDICDFKEQPITKNVTVGERYNQTKFGMLRFYLLSKRKVLDDTCMACSCQDRNQVRENVPSEKKPKPKAIVSKIESVDLTNEKPHTSTSSNDTNMSQTTAPPRIKLKLKSTEHSNQDDYIQDLTV